MALKLWMPMNQDLRQQGLSSIIPTQTSGFTKISAGKLGACYKFTSVFDTLLPISEWDWTTQSVSFGCWAKISKTELAALVATPSYSSTYTTMGGTLLGRDSYGGLAIRWQTNNIYTDSTLNKLYVYTHMRNTSSATHQTGSQEVPFDTWFHIMTVVDRTENQIKLYLNGELVKSVALTMTGTFTTGTFRIAEPTWHGGNGNASPGCWQLNDVRVYNHALNSIEVKEIAKGLVLHYPLNKDTAYISLKDKTAGYNVYNNFGSDVTYSLTATGEQYRGTPVRRLTATINNSNRINSFKTELWSHGVYNWQTTFKANTKYVFWIYYKPINYTDIRVGGTASNISGWTEIPPQKVEDGWYRVGQYRNGTVTTDKTDNIFVSFTWASAAVNTPISIDFACPMLIEGLTDIQEAAERNNGSTTVFDTSGYNNNGELHDTNIQLTSDNSKYNYSIKNNQVYNSSNYPLKGNLALSDIEKMTVAFWAKPTTNGHQDSGIFSTTANSIPTDYQATAMNHYDGRIACTNTSNTTANLTVSNQFTLNEWHHYCIVYDGAKVWFYKDGVSKASVAQTGKLKPFTSIFPFYSCAGGAHRTTSGNLSDFRIYTTALSETDIKSLYQNEAYIDSSGIIYGKIHD